MRPDIDMNMSTNIHIRIQLTSSQVHMMQLADEFDLQTCTQTETGAHFAHFADGRKVKFETEPGHPLSSLGKMDYNTFITKVEKLRLEVSLENPEDCPLALEWDSITLEQFRKQHIWTAGLFIGTLLVRVGCCICTGFDRVGRGLRVTVTGSGWVCIIVSWCCYIRGFCWG